MISIHRIARLAAKISTHNQDAHWLELILTEPDGETQCSVTLYFQTRNRGFNEERRFVVDLAEAINGLRPMEIGDWSPPEAASSPTAPLGPTVAPSAEESTQ